MMSDGTNLEVRANGPTRRQAIVGVAMAFGGLTLGSTKAWAGVDEEISHTAESIHQEAVFKASRKRVYEALTDTKQFNKVIELSGVMKSGMLSPGADKPTKISSEVGARSYSSAGISPDDTSNLCRTSESCRPGERVDGRRASIRLRSSSSWSKARGPRSYLTIRAFLKAMPNIWLRDGKLTIGSPSINCWLRRCAWRRS